MRFLHEGLAGAPQWELVPVVWCTNMTDGDRRHGCGVGSYNLGKDMSATQLKDCDQILNQRELPEAAIHHASYRIQIWVLP